MQAFKNMLYGEFGNFQIQGQEVEFQNATEKELFEFQKPYNSDGNKRPIIW